MDATTFLETVYGTNGYTAEATALGNERYNVDFTNGETTDSVVVRIGYRNTGRPYIL